MNTKELAKRLKQINPKLANDLAEVLAEFREDLRIKDATISSVQDQLAASRAQQSRAVQLAVRESCAEQIKYQQLLRRELQQLKEEREGLLRQIQKLRKDSEPLNALLQFQERCNDCDLEFVIVHSGKPDHESNFGRLIENEKGTLVAKGGEVRIHAPCGGYCPRCGGSNCVAIIGSDDLPKD